MKLWGNWITDIIAKIWNDLPEKVMEVTIFTTIKKYLDKHLNHHDIDGCRPNTSKWD